VSATSSTDWTNMSASDLMNVTPATWMDAALPGWRDRSYGDYLRATPADWMSMMYPSMSGGTQPGTRRRHWQHRHHEHHHRHRGGCDCGCHEHRHGDCEHRHHREHGCHDCGCDCECCCCIGDVDIVVYARVGEQRVVPIVVENEHRRESDVRLELSEWTTRAGNAAPVQTVVLEPTEFKLAPCGRENVTLALRVEAAAGEQREGEAPKDVETCLVATADLRLLGCEHRPVRIAVAIVPRYCDPCRIACGCCCC
jgi:hypothetical protein